MRIEEAWAKLHEAADLAAARGSLLFHLDLATEIACTALTARGIVVDALATLVDERGYRVVAFDAAAVRHALAEVQFDAQGEAIVLPKPDRLPPRALSLAEARATIAAARFDDDRPRAAIVVPAEDSRAPIGGYALAIGDDPETAYLAGHWLMTIDPTGRRVVAREPLEASGDLAWHMTRRLRDTTLVVAGAVPTDLHTYLSLKHDVPLIVETRASGARWRVDGERTRVA